MPGPLIGVSTALTNAAESAANTETVVGTVRLPASGVPGQQAVLLIATVTVTPGASIASVQFQWRRASLTGTAVRDTGALVVPAPAAGLSVYTVMAVDTVGAESVSAPYVLTYKGASEAGAATFNSFHGVALGI